MEYFIVKNAFKNRQKPLLNFFFFLLCKGKNLVYFMEDGTFKIIKTENGEVLFEVKKKNCLNNPIVSSSWVNYNKVSAVEKINPFKKSQVLDHLILQLGPNIYSDK